MVIRNATQHDVTQLQVFQQEAWQYDYIGHVPAAYLPIALERYGSAEALAKTVEHDRYYFVAEDAGGLSGCLAGVHLNEHEVEIFWLHITRRCRRQGLGKKLVEHLIAELEPQIYTLHVVTFQTNAKAMAFYKSLGFKVFQHEVDDHNGLLIQNLRLTRPVHAIRGN
jgi:diamine N-acetyltransferase